MDGDIRAKLERLFAVSNGITDPILKLQFDKEAFSVAHNTTGFGLEALREVQQQEKEATRVQTQIKKFQGLLSDIQDELRGGQLSRAVELLQNVRVGSTQVDDGDTPGWVARLGGQYERFENYLWERTGRQFAGIRQSMMPTLNYNLNGYQGVTMVAGPTNSSKTQFFLHTVISALNDNPDLAIIYLALDQPESKLLSRICSCITGQNVEDFEQGSNRGDNKNPMTDQDLMNRVMGQDWLREHLGSRLFLFDRAYFPRLRFQFEYVRDIVRYVRQESGLKRVAIFIDYLDQLEVEGQEKMKDIYVDQERVQALLDWALLNPDDPILAITEVNKESQKDGDAVKSTGVMGTSRKIYAPDNVLIINPWTNEEIMSWTDDCYGGDLSTMRLRVLREPLEYSDKEMRDKKFRKEADKRRQWLSNHDLSLGSISVTKVRDGGRRCKVWYTNYFRCSRFTEGLSVDSAA